MLLSFLLGGPFDSSLHYGFSAFLFRLLSIDCTAGRTVSAFPRRLTVDLLAQALLKVQTLFAASRTYRQLVTYFRSHLLLGL